MVTFKFFWYSDVYWRICSLPFFCIVADRSIEAVIGDYRVRAIDYWRRPSAFSPVIHYPATWNGIGMCSTLKSLCVSESFGMICSWRIYCKWFLLHPKWRHRLLNHTSWQLSYGRLFLNLLIIRGHLRLRQDYKHLPRINCSFGIVHSCSNYPSSQPTVFCCLIEVTPRMCHF